MSIDLKNIFDAVPALFLAVAPDSPRFTILAATDAYLHATKTQRSVILGQALFDIFPDNPDTPEVTATRNTRDSLERAIQQRVPDTMMVQRHDIRQTMEKGGCFEERYWSSVTTPVLDKTGKVVYLIHHVEDVTENERLKRKGYEQQASADNLRRDITEHKQAEEVSNKGSETMPRLSEQEFHLLADAMPQIVWATLPDGRNIYFNQQWADYTGLTMEESYGHGWNTPFHPDDKQRAWDAWQLATQYNERYSLEGRLRRADGVYRWWLIRGEPMRDENGEILKWIGTCTDIEELKRSEAMLHEAKNLLEQRVDERTKALKESEEQFRVLIQNLQSAVALVNECGAFTIVNQAFLRIFELNDDSSIKNVNDRDWSQWQVFDEDGTLLDVDEHPVRKAALKGSPVRDQLIAVKAPANTTIKWLLVSAEPILDSQGHLYRLICTYYDFTERKRAEDALRVSEQRLVLASRAGEVGLFEWNTGATEAYWNAEHYKLLGLDPGSPATFDAWQARVHPDDRDRVMHSVANLITDARNGMCIESHHDEYRALWLDGTVVWLESVVSIEFDGNVVMRGAVRNITDRKRDEEDLARTRNILAESQRIAHLGSFEYDADTRTTVWSEEEFRIYGLDPASPSPTYEVMLAKHIHPGDAALLHETFAKALQSCSVYELEHRIVRPDGSVRIVNDLAHPYFDEKGKLVRYVGATLDVTERKAAEQALRESQDRERQRAGELQAILDTAPISIWIAHDAQCRRITGNAAADLLLRAPRSANISASAPPGEVAVSYKVLRAGVELKPEQMPAQVATLTGRPVLGDELDLVFADGRTLHLIESAVPLLDAEGRVRGAIIAGEDITERKHAEEEIKASLAEKEALLKEIHHRVKNNLQVISSLISLQSDNLTDERIRDEFNDVRDRVSSMALIHEKLYQENDLARLNFADYTASLLRSLWHSHSTLAEQVRLTLALTPVALPVEAAVPCGLILNELAGNALKHAFPNSSDGEVTVGLEHDATTGTVCLRVRDNGVGLPEGLDWRQSRSLGLRLVQILAGQLGGTLEMGTGPGTEFQIIFPAKEVHS